MPNEQKKTDNPSIGLSDLLACPCCGGKAELEECEIGPVIMFENNAWRVQCQECGLMLHAYERETAIAGWNKREIKCDIYEFGDDGVNPYK